MKKGNFPLSGKTAGEGLNKKHKAYSAGLWGYLLILPSFAGVCLFQLIPYLRSLFYTFTQGIVTPRFVGLENFAALLSDPLFLQAAGNTFLFLAVGGVLVLALALFVGFVCGKAPFTWQRWAILLPLVVPAASLALGWQSLFGADGLVNQILSRMGLPARDFLYGEAAFPLMVLLYLLKNVGYLSIILADAIQRFPPEHRDNYLLDSSSETGYVFPILLPQLRSTMLFCAIVAISNYFLMFRDIYALYGDNPPARLYMLQHFMNRNFYQLNYQRLSTAAFLTSFVMAVLIVVWLYTRRRRNHVE